MKLLSKKFAALILLFGFIFIYSAKKEANACSRILWDTKYGKFIGRTMDLYMPDNAKIIFYPRGIKRDGGAGKGSCLWKSKYASLVITCFDMTSGAAEGFNEKGLAINLLYLSGTEYETRDNRPALGNQGAQYLLDNFSTVEEALKGFEKVQIVPVKSAGRQWPVHISIEDASGDSAIIEFIDGKRVIYRGKQYSVMTNEPAFNVQLANLKKYTFAGGKLPLPGDIDAGSRFARLTFFLKCLPDPQNVQDAVYKLVGAINTVLVPYGAYDTSGSETEDAWPTRWYNISDLTKKVLYFHATDCPNLISIDFNKFNPDSKNILYLDPYNKNLAGEVSGFFNKYKK